MTCFRPQFRINSRRGIRIWHQGRHRSCKSGVVSTSPVDKLSGTSSFIHEADLIGVVESQIQQAVQAERLRIGADLHDELGQLLTGITCLSTALIARLRGRDDLAAEDATQIADVARHALAQVRSVAHGLVSVRHTRGGLVGALEGLQTQIRHLHKADLRLDLPAGRDHLDDETTAHLFRIVQEAVANAIRHGGATSIEVSLQRRGTGHRLAIVDNGRGFERDTSGESNGAGLNLMSYRAARIGGTLLVSSDLMTGTRLEISFTSVETCPHENVG